MKKIRKMRKSLVIPAVLLSLALVWAGCGGGGGGGGGPVTFSSPSQAAALGSTGEAVMATAQTTAVTAITFGTSNIPAFAPSAKKVPSTDKVAVLDPRLKTLLDKMKNHIQTPAIKNAMKKARELGASLAPVNLTLDAPDGVCLNGGSIVISGDDSSTLSITDYDVTITFNNCRDVLGPYYTELSGSMHMVEYTVIGSSSDASLTVTNFNEKVYSNSAYTVLSSADVLNGSFRSVDNGTSGYNTANGSFTSADYEFELDAAFTFSGLREDWTDTVTATIPATGTMQDTVNGTFTFTVTDTFYNVSAGFTFGMTDLSDTVIYNNNGTADLWLNGSFSMSWNPSIPGCLAGTVTFTTTLNDPMHHLDQTLISCPVSGMLTVNNATIQFGTSAGLIPPAVKVTVGTVWTTYADCYELSAAGGICTM